LTDQFLAVTAVSNPEAQRNALEQLCTAQGTSAPLVDSSRCHRSVQWKHRDDHYTYCTFFCVHSKSFCTSLAAFMPSEKLALVFASRALACACKASSSLFLAFSSPDLITVSIDRSLYLWRISHLRLLHQTLVHGDRVVCLRQTVIHVIQQVDTRVCASRRVTFATCVLA